MDVYDKRIHIDANHNLHNHEIIMVCYDLKMTTKRVLLTGASGFLGSHCLRHLLMNTDWHIVCPVSFKHHGVPERIKSSAWGLMDDVDSAHAKRIDVIWCDLSSPIADTTIRQIGGIDYIINYAAQSHVDRSIIDPVGFIQNNVNVVLNVLELARIVRPKIFIQISTDEVYGPAPLDYAHREWDCHIPSNPYSASKSAQEAIAISYWRTYGVPVVITNCMNLIGEMQDSEKFVPMTIKKVLSGDTVTIHGAPGGRIGSRFYLHARNLADAVLFLLRRYDYVPLGEYNTGADRPDKWHIVGEREVSNLEMAQLIATYLDRELHYEIVDFHSSRPGHDLRYALDGSKIADIGWLPPISFEKSLKRMIDWTLLHPLWLR